MPAGVLAAALVGHCGIYPAITFYGSAMASGPEFAQIINDRRLELGYSLGQLANRLGTTASKLRAWERGQGDPDAATIQRLAEELDLDVDLLAASVAARAAAEPDPAGDATAVVAAQPQEAPVVEADVVEADVVEPAAATGESDAEEAPEEPAESGAEEAEADVVAAAMEEKLEQAGEAEAVTGFDVGDAVGVTSFDGDEGEHAEQDPTGLVAAGSTDGFDGLDIALEEQDQHDDGAAVVDAAASEADTAAQPDDESGLVEQPTEAVPVVSAGGVDSGVPAAGVAVATAPPRTAPAPVEPIERVGMFAPIERIFRAIFDPKRRILFWIRTVLTLIALVVLLRVLLWAVPEFFDALKDILDTIESTPTEVEPGRTVFES